jgi:hypothetical protein
MVERAAEWSKSSNISSRDISVRYTDCQGLVGGGGWSHAILRHNAVGMRRTGSTLANSWPYSRTAPYDKNRSSGPSSPHDLIHLVEAQ